MVEYIPETLCSVAKPGTAAGGERKGKRRKVIAWSVNVFTVVLYMVDPKYMLCKGKYK